jgi:hypothetical protein
MAKIERTPEEKVDLYFEAIEILTETRPTENDKRCITAYFIDSFIRDLNESLEVAREIENPQAEGLIAGSIVIWTEILNQCKHRTNGK